ncbi:alpha/beta hydrolase [Krasilnikovia sp. MM14-A1004]|uniref:alpha/beta hydrolase n=1 Tax=Krasilnikovia sp. MM14-A1004 TaxID=3373541 RepID=UPI00399C798C
MLTGIVVPGRAYTAQAPLLDLADRALRDRRAHIETISWTVPSGLLDVGPEPFVRAHVDAALHRAHRAAPHARPVVIAKSLGCWAAALVAERGLPAVWLTPVLTADEVVAAIGRNPAPALLIGGTADFAWVPEAAQATGKTVVTVVDGDHGLRVPGPLRRYTDALGTVATAIEEFLDALG